ATATIAATTKLPKAPSLSVDFDRQAATVVRGAQFPVSGTVATSAGRGVPADFTLAVTDPAGRVLGTQDVTAAGDGTFATTVPGSITRGLPQTGDATHLAVRALDASYDGRSVDDAGAGAVAVEAAATDLEVENSFVSSVGWVKPGETYPSRIIVRNPTAAPVTGATVLITAPQGTTLTDASGPGSHPVTDQQILWSLPPVP